MVYGPYGRGELTKLYDLDTTNQVGKMLILLTMFIYLHTKNHAYII